MMGRNICTLYLTLLLLTVYGQEDLNFGEWEAHLPYQRGLALTQSPNKIYFATDFSIMSIDKSDNSLEFISKVEGLSNIGIIDLRYDYGSERILVAYINNEIDIITEEGVINFADIRNNLGIVGDKRINDIFFREKVAYLSLGFGVVSFDMERLEFGFTTQMGMQVNATTIDESGFLYAATEDGLYRVDLNSGRNLSDFGNWEQVGVAEGLPLTYDALDVEWHGGSLWLLWDNEVWRNEGNLFSLYIAPEDGETIRFLSTEGPNLMVGSRFQAQNRALVRFVDNEGVVNEGTRSCSNNITDVVVDENGRVWYADEWRGFRYTDGENGDCVRVGNNSIFSNSSSELHVHEGKLYVASGGVSEGFSPDFNRDGYYVLESSGWKNFNESNVPIFRDEEVLNIFEIIHHPVQDKLILGSFFAGLIEVNLETQEYIIFNSENSPVIGSPGFPIQEKVAGLAFDDQNNLWISSFDAAKPLITKSAEGNFHSYEVISSSRLGHITVDDFGYKWIQVTGAAGGVLVYDSAGEVKDPSSHRQRFINTANSNLPSNVVNCITKDLDGSMWVGTGAGPVIFAGDAFNQDSEGNFSVLGGIEIVFEDSIPARLLETEDIRAIAVDGGNQKWFGSRNGIFVQSPSGVEKVARYTADNSPLFSNNIIDLEYDPESGLMHIASDGGIQSIKTNTTGGGRVHKSNVYAYPNPVRPDYRGVIAFQGLARDARIKVTDINGQLVHESIALGGLATWDGRDYSGRAVASGVYLVFSNGNEIIGDNPDTAVTKVLIIR